MNILVKLFFSAWSMTFLTIILHLVMWIACLPKFPHPGHIWQWSLIYDPLFWCCNDMQLWGPDQFLHVLLLPVLDFSWWMRSSLQLGLGTFDWVFLFFILLQKSTLLRLLANDFIADLAQCWLWSIWGPFHTWVYILPLWYIFYWRIVALWSLYDFWWKVLFWMDEQSHYVCVHFIFWS